MEAVSRLVPGFMGKVASGDDESFSQGLLEYPHFTRPPVLDGHSVPEVLFGGNHEKIARWRRNEALATTLSRRPELFEEASLDAADGAVLKTFTRKSCGPAVSFCLVHAPVVVDGHRTGTSSLTSMDVHDLSRVSRAYGLGPCYFATPLEDQRALVEGMLRHWERAGEHGHADRADALRLARPVASVEDACTRIEREFGDRPLVVATSASWPAKRSCVSCTWVREQAGRRPVLVLLGTALGLSPKLVRACDAVLRPLRFMDWNHLAVRSAAAVIADRIVGDFW